MAGRRAPAFLQPFSRMMGVPGKQRTRAFHLPAPVGGINTVSPASGMSPSDCLYLFNLIPFQYGLRVRSGWKEHVTNVGTPVPFPDLYQDSSPLMFNLAGILGGARIGAWTGTGNPGVRSILSFAGSDDTGSQDRLFACTKEGIYDTTNRSSAPALVYTFINQNLFSGKGVGTAFTNLAGEHFYLYTDEANGYIVYRESTQTWEKIFQTPTVAWEPGTAYVVGDEIANGGLAYRCVTSGTSLAEWLPGTVYSLGTKVTANGNTYEVKTPGTSNAAWAGGTTYLLGDKVANEGLLYECVTLAAAWLPLTTYQIGDYTYANYRLYRVIPGAEPWAANTAYAVPGLRCINDDGKMYEVVIGGISAASGGPTGTSSAIVDNTITWKYVPLVSGSGAPIGTGTYTDNDILWEDIPMVSGPAYTKGPTGTATFVDGTVLWKYLSVAGPFGTGNTTDGVYTTTVKTAVVWKYISPQGPQGAENVIQDGTVVWDYFPTITGEDPNSFRFVMVWKNRVWFAKNSSSEAVYLPVSSYVGTVDNNNVEAGGTINFGARFRYGGNLVGLWNWTVDGGVGIDDHLVGISSAGDVVIYTGTDPAIPGQFGLKGVWWVGPVPPGRKIASQFGGDLFILALTGCLPLSKLVAGYMVRDPNIYATAKISNLFNVMMTERGQYPGWEINIHPTDNLLVIMVPASPGKVQEQLCMSMASKGWSRSVGVPMTTMETWHGKLFFGTADSRVCIHDGEVDGLTLDATTNWAIDFAILTSFQNLGSANKKRVHMVRPLFMTDGTNPGYETQSRWDFDISAVDAMPIPADLLETSVWNQGVWNRNKWDDGIDKGGQYYGASGMGTHVAIILRGAASTPTTFVGFDVAMDQGGIL